jgi:hypothetical protein
MKKLLILLTISITLNSCNKCPTRGIEPNHIFVDKFTNILFVENLQTTYNLNDTIWFRISIPEYFESVYDNIQCELSDSSLSIYSPALYLYTLSDTTIVYNSELFYKKGILSNNNYILKKENNKYEGVFGVLINNLNYIEVALSDFDYIWISTPGFASFCYDPEFECENIRQGFEFQTQIEGLNDSKFSFTVVP